MCSFYKGEILEKARKLMKSIANMTYNVDFNVGVQMCQVFKAKKKKKTNNHIGRLHKYEHMYEQPL